MDKEVDNFYYSFKSSDDLQTHSKNNTENFRITLKEPIQLEGEWEVGLSSLFLPHIMKYEFKSLFTVLIHPITALSKDIDDDKYWIEVPIEIDANIRTFTNFFLQFMTQIRVAVLKWEKLNKITRRLGRYWTVYKGPFNWYNSYRIKWGTLIVISTELANFMNVDWLNKTYLKKDLSETTYGLRNIDHGDRGRHAHNLLILKGKTWVTLNSAKKDMNNIGTEIKRTNNDIVKNEIEILKEKDKEDEEKTKIHTDKLYHNTILVKTNLINQIKITKPEYRNIIRVVALPQVKESHQFDFSPIFYYPLRVNILNTIKIKLKRFKFSDIIDHITFEGDTAIVILHFRKRHSIL